MTTYPITLSNLACESHILYEIINDDNSPLLNPPFTYDEPNKKFSVEELLDTSITGSYSILYRITNSHSGTFVEDAFKV